MPTPKIFRDTRVLFLLVACFVAVPAHAITVWTDWTSATINSGSGGSAAGTVNGIGVTYSGQLIGAVTNGTSNIWNPSTSFVGGTSTASPGVVNDDLRLNGIGFAGPNTVTFASPVANPLIAIWSLGAPTTAATFTFSATPVLEAGGPNSLFGGSSIAVLPGNVVSGNEGNGVVQFTGTFSSISWTDTPENFYAFTVGVNGPLAPPVTGVPEPGALMLLALGLVALITARVRKA